MGCEDVEWLKGGVNSGVKYVVRVEKKEGVENDAEL